MAGEAGGLAGNTRQYLGCEVEEADLAEGALDDAGAIAVEVRADAGQTLSK